MQKISVLGGGSWGTALVKIISESSDKIIINWGIRSSKTVAHIKEHKHNPDYLSSVYLELNKVFPSNNFNEVVKNSDIIIIAIPSAFLYESFKKIEKKYLENKIIIVSLKGLLPDKGITCSEFLINYYGIKKNNLFILSGPCHSEEVANEKLSYLTIASYLTPDSPEIKIIYSILKSHYINLVFTNDFLSTEYVPILKNVYAITVGIACSLNYGDNFIAVLVSNCLREIELFLNKNFSSNVNLSQSAFLGDLLVTTYSQFSRNRLFGNMLGKGYSVSTIFLEMKMVAEGYYTVQSIYNLIKKNKISMPILEATYNIIYNSKNPNLEIKSILNLLK